MKFKIAPSILTADFSEMGKVIENVTALGADYVHCDVMDGVFVPNMTFGPKMVEGFAKHTHLPLDVHMMVINPAPYFEAFARAGASIITFHIESETPAKEGLDAIHKLGIKAGLVVSPDTPIEALEPFLADCDMVLVMSVYPGFGGQKLIPATLEKVRWLVEKKKQNGYSFEIEIDGGVNAGTIESVLDAGAEVLVIGSAILDAEDPKKAMETFRGFTK